MSNTVWNDEKQIYIWFISVNIHSRHTCIKRWKSYTWLHALTAQVQNLIRHRITFIDADTYGKYIDEQKLVIEKLTEKIPYKTVSLEKWISTRTIHL